MRLEIKGKKDAVLKWNVTEFTKTSGMAIQINFKEPLLISHDVQDILEIEILQSETFVSFKNRSMMISKGTLMTKKIPR